MKHKVLIVTFHDKGKTNEKYVSARHLYHAPDGYYISGVSAVFPEEIAIYVHRKLSLGTKRSTR
jgi:hypothetical protein